MITIAITLQGKQENLRDAMVSACHYYSTSHLIDEQLDLTYITECLDGEAAIASVHDSINPEILEMLGVEIVAIKKIN